MSVKGETQNLQYVYIQFLKIIKWEELMVKSKTNIIFTVAFIVSFAWLATVVALSTMDIQILNTGQINAVGIGVYSDSACTIPLTSLNWNMNQNTISHITYLKNIKNSNVILSMATSDWICNPTNTSAIVNLTWNAPLTLTPGQSIPVTFTLTTVNTENVDITFNFKTTITGTQN